MYHCQMSEFPSLNSHCHCLSGLAVALETMQDVAKYINEVKRDNETINTILEIQRSITDINMPLNTYLTDYGKLQVRKARLRFHQNCSSVVPVFTNKHKTFVTFAMSLSHDTAFDLLAAPDAIACLCSFARCLLVVV